VHAIGGAELAPTGRADLRGIGPNTAGQTARFDPADQ